MNKCGAFRHGRMNARPCRSGALARISDFELYGDPALLDIDKIRQLVAMMVDNDLVELSLRDGEEEVSLRRPNACNSPAFVATAGQQMPTMMVPPTGAVPAGAGVAEDASTAKEDESRWITVSSPMVGTFYAGPDPDSPPFVQVGSEVHVGSILCILEAMKVFNEIKSEIAGKIERILAKNSQAVEFGQPLFLIAPA